MDPHKQPCSHREAQRETASTEKAMGETPGPWAFCDGVWGRLKSHHGPLGAAGTARLLRCGERGEGGV